MRQASNGKYQLPSKLTMHACTRCRLSILGCRRLTVIEDEVSEAYPVGVIALKGGGVQVQQRSGRWI